MGVLGLRLLGLRRVSFWVSLDCTWIARELIRIDGWKNSLIC